MDLSEKWPPKKHILHSGFSNDTLRKWQTIGTELHPWNLMYPLFIVDMEDDIQPIDTLPGISRYGVNKIVAVLEPLVKKGLSSTAASCSNTKEHSQWKTSRLKQNSSSRGD